MACQPISSWEAAPAACISAVICIASLVGYSNSLVMKDQMEVSPLSCGVCFISSPFPYRMALACSIFLCPQPYRHSLQFAFPMLGELRIFHVPLAYRKMRSEERRVGKQWSTW